MLRHTAVVWSLAAGVPIQVVSEMIGHTSLQMTYDVYGGLINLSDPAMGRAMADAMRVSAERGPTPLFGRDDAPPRRTRPRTRRVAS
jgi:integrase